MTIDELSALVHANSCEKGFWPDVREVGQEHISMKLMLIVSELSEALEEMRSGNNGQGLEGIHEGYNGKPEGFSIELVDALIRLLDLMEFIGIPVEEYTLLKHTYNTKRPHLHGKKF